MKKVTVTAPPGRLGIHLENFQSENSSTIVSSISESSPLADKIFQGDCIVKINDVDVRDMDTSGIFEVFQLYAEEDKRLTILRESTSKQKPEHGGFAETVSIPRGKIGIHLRDIQSEESSTVVSSVSEGSPLAGKVFAGDYIINVNDIDVRDMDTAGIFEVFNQCSQDEKVLTILHKGSNTETIYEEPASTGSTCKSSKLSQKKSRHHSSRSASEKQRSKHRNHKKKKLCDSAVSSSETKVEERQNESARKAVFERSHPSLKSSIAVEHCTSSGAPTPPGFAFDDSIKTKSSMKEQKMLDQSGPVALEVSELPLPPCAFDESSSKSSQLKQKNYHYELNRQENSPIPVGFVFDDSIKASIASKMGRKSFCEENSNTCDSTIPPDETESFSHESILQSTSKLSNEGASSSSNGESSTVPLTGNHESSHSNSNQHTLWSTETQASSRVTRDTYIQHTGSSSTNSSADIESGLANEFEIVADAVAVKEPDVYDAEAAPPNIVINQTYAYPNEQSSHNRKSMWDSKFCYPVMILFALILGCGFIILGITLGVKKNNNSNNGANSTSNYVDSTSVDVSSFSIDDHSQVSNVAYNQTTNHYIIQYNNGTSAEVAYVLINDNDSLISSLHFDETLNHYIVTYKNSTIQDIGSTPPDLSSFLKDEDLSTSSTTPFIDSIDLIPSNDEFQSGAVNQTTTSKTTTSATTEILPNNSFQSKAVNETMTPQTTTFPTTTSSEVISPNEIITSASISSDTTTKTTTTTPTPSESILLNESSPVLVQVYGNDKCLNAHSIDVLPAYRAGSSQFATPDFSSTLENTCGTNLDSKGVWYSLRSEKRRVVRLEYELKTQDLGDSILSIFKGDCNASNLSCIGYTFGGDRWNGLNEVAIYEFLTEIGETYRILLSGATPDAAGNYEFRVTEYDVPKNDACQGAIEISSHPNIFSGTLLGATPDFDAYSVKTQGCNDIDWNTRGVWYKIIGKGSNIRLEYYLYTQDIGNSELSVFMGSCGDFACFANKKGDDRWNGFNDPVVYEFFAQKDEVYWLLLSGFSFNTAGSYELKVSEYDVPSNDVCVSATEVTVSPAAEFFDASLDHSTLGATPDFTEFDLRSTTCGVNWYTRGLWYRFVGRGAVIRIDYQLHSQDVGRSQLTLSTGSCDNLSCIKLVESNDRWNGINDNLTFEFIAEMGQAYFVRLSGLSFDTAASYDFTVTEYEIPSNDNCVGASALSSGSLVPGTTSGSTYDFGIFNQQEECGGKVDTRGNWYNFKGNGQLASFTIAPEYEYAQVSLFSGACDSLTCEYYKSLRYAEETTFDFVAANGKQYQLLISGTSSDAVGDYSLSMVQYNRPDNDVCINAVKMSTFPYKINDGNLKGSTPDFNIDTVKCGDENYSGVWYSFIGTGKPFVFELQTATTDSIWAEIAVFQGQCGRFECVVQEEVSGADVVVNVIVPLTTEGAQYKVLIAVLGYLSYDVPFQFTVSESLPDID